MHRQSEEPARCSPRLRSHAGSAYPCREIGRPIRPRDRQRTCGSQDRRSRLSAAGRRCAQDLLPECAPPGLRREHTVGARGALPRDDRRSSTPLADCPEVSVLPTRETTHVLGRIHIGLRFRNDTGGWRRSLSHARRWQVAGRQADRFALPGPRRHHAVHRMRDTGGSDEDTEPNAPCSCGRRDQAESNGCARRSRADGYGRGRCGRCSIALRPIRPSLSNSRCRTRRPAVPWPRWPGW